MCEVTIYTVCDEIFDEFIVGGVDRSEKCRHTGTSSRRSSRCSANVNTGESSGSEPDSDSNAKH